MVSRELIIHRALRETLQSLGEASSDAITVHMARKYGIFLDDPKMNIESVAPAIYDFFGLDAGRFIIENVKLRLEELTPAEPE